MTRNVKLIIAYDGTPFLGWQKTKEGPSIEAELQKALKQILQYEPVLQAASRTDAGVHAQGQVVNFFINDEKKALDSLQYSLNCLLPSEIRVRSISEATLEFHPTLHSISKEYRYSICNSSFQMPDKRFYSWHYPKKLDISLMKEASNFFIGAHDFGSFCNAKKNEEYADKCREVEKIIFYEKQHGLEIAIIGKNFLYKMVRNIVGTLVYVGVGKIQVNEVPEILQSGDRKKAGITAPAHGLALYQINY